MFTVFLVDDDAGVLRALSRLLGARGYAIQRFSSPKAFLIDHDASIRGCAIVGISMPNCDGLKLQRTLIKAGSLRPIIFLANNGDIPTCVRAMKASAVDYLIKPVKAECLLAAIKVAKRRDAEARRTNADLQSIKSRLATLTPREFEVMRHVISGKINRQIADDLGTGEKTIKVHRGRAMKKLNVHSVPDLVRAAEKAGISPSKL